MPAATTHRWSFTRSGGFDQARLETAEDLKRLEDLDQKLWAALACPVRGLEFDERTLSLVDTDADGRVRAPEVLRAVQWCEDHLKDVAALKAGTDVVPLTAIHDGTDSGRLLLASARRILSDLGKPTATSISLADVADTKRIFEGTRFNGDGVIPSDAAEDASVRKVIEEAIDCMGAVPDRSGKPGLDQAKADAFFQQLEDYAAWAARPETDPSLAPLGAGTAAAADAVRAIQAKAEDYYARCRVAEFDARALAAVNRSEEEYLAIAARDLTVSAPEIATLPLARIEPGRALPLAEGVNPAWAGRVADLRRAAVTPVFGAARTSLAAADWEGLVAKIAPFEAWRAAKPATNVERLGPARAREILAGKARAEITRLLGEDRALEKEVAAVGEVERLVRYHRDLYRLLHNFVNFADFYSVERMAIFQVGVLYLDGRACELCVRVDDPGKHALLAGFAKAYLAYCDCTRPSGEKMQIAAAFTGGDSDFLMVGRNGIFYDRKGRDWDATITKVIENPISVRQAFWSPYKKLVRLIEERTAKRAAAAEAENDAALAAAADKTVHADKHAAEAAAGPKKIDVGAVAAMGVAFGAIGTLLATLVGYLTGLFRLPFWQLCLACAGILLLISAPSMLIAWLKLRQRNLGPILDANGWAVNGRVRMNVRFGGSLTSVAELPPGAIPAAADPFGEKPRTWPKLVLAVVIACALFSFLNDPDRGWLYAWTKPGTAFHDAVGFSIGSPRPVVIFETSTTVEPVKAPPQPPKGG